MSICREWFVPGRLEVFGKHTDYAGGRSLVAAVPRGFTVRATPADDGLVVVADAVLGQRAEFGSANPGSAAGWRRYVATVVRRLSLNFPGANLSARIEISSTLPRAAGISSSSALVIGIAEALIARGGIEGLPLWQETIRTAEDRASYFGCIENGASFGALAGDEGVGTHGGSEDHAAILTSRSGWLQQFSFAPLQRDRRIQMPAGWSFVVASTGIRASKTGDARDAYNRASASASRIVAAWRERHPGDTRTLGQLVREDAKFHDLALPDDLGARLQHFEAEDARVVRAGDAFERADVAAIGRLAADSQRDAEVLLGNQVPETTELVALALEAGAAAASGFGAGWGGSVWALVQTPAAAPFLERWLQRYRARHPNLTSEGFVSPPSDGIRQRHECTNLSS